MRLYEHEAKKLLRKEGIPTPRGELAPGVDEALRIADEIDLPVVLKAQVLCGGRMKAGGVSFISSAGKIEVVVAAMLALEFRGSRPDGILVEKVVPVQKEYYLGIIYDTVAKRPVAIFSDRGGIDIEEVAEHTPERVAKLHLSSLVPVFDFQLKQLVSSLGITGGELNSITRIFSHLARCFFKYDLTLAEINPLGELADGSFCALDAHVEMDDDAAFRQVLILNELGAKKGRQARQPTPFELKAAEVDASDHRGVAGRVVEFEGSLGLVIGAGGASLTIFDAVREHGGRPANYCEIGGNPSVNKVCQFVKLLLSKPGVKKIAVIMNVVNNTRADLVARGVIKGVIQSGYSPADKVAVFRIPGAWEEEGFRLLRHYGVHFLDRRYSLDHAVRQALERAG